MRTTYMYSSVNCITLTALAYLTACCKSRQPSPQRANCTAYTLLLLYCPRCHSVSQSSERPQNSKRNGQTRPAFYLLPNRTPSYLADARAASRQLASVSGQTPPSNKILLLLLLLLSPVRPALSRICAKTSVTNCSDTPL